MVENLKLIVTVLITNLLFPVFGYTLTQFGASAENYDIALDADTLISAGIWLGKSESDNITYEGSWVYYEDFNESEYRIQWVHYAVSGDWFEFQRQSPIGKILDTWIFPHTIWTRGAKSGIMQNHQTNQTLLENYDQSFNWSRFVTQEGMMVFFTAPQGVDNFTDAIMNDGNVTATLGQTLEETEEINFGKFITWYTGLIVGDQTWGLPAFFSWLVRINTALAVLASVILVKEMFRL